MLNLYFLFLISYLYCIFFQKINIFFKLFNPFIPFILLILILIKIFLMQIFL